MHRCFLERPFFWTNRKSRLFHVLHFLLHLGLRGVALGFVPIRPALAFAAVLALTRVYAVAMNLGFILGIGSGEGKAGKFSGVQG